MRADGPPSNAATRGERPTAPRAGHLRGRPTWAIGLCALGFGALATAGAHEPPRAAAAPVAESATAWAWRATWQTPAQAPAGGVIDPVDMDIDEDGAVYVLDRGLHRVQRFRGQAVEAAYGGGVGLADGALASPQGVAADAARGRLLVADTGHETVARIDLATGALEAWQGFGRPESVAVAPGGRTYVYERERNGISGRSVAGEEELLFPVQRALSFVADLPRGLAVAPSGSVFFAAENPVANSPNVLYEFAAGGDVVPPRTALSWQIFDIAFDSAGRMWLLDGTGSRLVGDLDRADGATGRGVSVPGGARALAAGADGRLALLYGPTSERAAGILELQADGSRAERVGYWAFPPLDAGWLPAPQRVAVAPDGAPLIVDGTERAVQLGRDRSVRDALARPGLLDAVRLADGDWLVARTRFAATYDPKDDPDVAAPGTRRVRIERYAAGAATEPSPVPRWTWERVEPVDALPVTTLASLVHDPATGRTYALDVGGGTVIVLDRDGGLLEERTLPERPGFPRWSDLVVLPGGALGALHGGARELHVLSPDGGAPLALPIDAATTPSRIDVDGEGRLYVLTADRSIVVAAPDGSRIASWRLPPPALGEPEAPSDLAVAQDATVYATDRAGMAVHVFSPVGDAHPTVFLPQLDR